MCLCSTAYHALEYVEDSLVYPEDMSTFSSTEIKDRDFLISVINHLETKILDEDDDTISPQNYAKTDFAKASKLLLQVEPMLLDETKSSEKEKLKQYILELAEEIKNVG